MKPIICIAPAPAVEPMFFNDGWMVNKKYFLGVSAGGGVPVMPHRRKSLRNKSATRRTHSCSTLFKRPANRYWASAAGSRILTSF